VVNRIKINPPLGYLDFLNLMINSKFILTDSGGIQEEATVLKVPCLTLRNNTERPITVKEGTNIIIGTNKKKIIQATDRILNNNRKEIKIPEFWDGKTAKRIIDKLVEKL
jgi:UDP-N-acetylglucosamine 2-epimerase (non-hydrolysing)